MANFSHLSGLQVGDATARYTFHNIVVNGRSPTLIVRPATQDNKPYQRELFKRHGSLVRRARASRNATPEMADEVRATDRELFPKHVVVGWEDMIDADGVELAFNATDCRAFLDALADWVLDDFFQFCRAQESFVEGISIDMRDVEDTAKN